MVVFPNAKINFGLNIVNKRPDGYHNIESVFYPIGLTDALEINLAKGNCNVFRSHGIPIPGEESDNLVHKAWKIMQDCYELPFIEIDLAKRIPMGGGVGGGSADAGFFVNLVDSFFKLGLSVLEKRSIAGQLGSDCPFFIENVPTFVSGRGEVLETIPAFLSGYYLVLVYEGFHISTAEAYSGIMPKPTHSELKEVIGQLPETWVNLVSNDFEPVVFMRFPELKRIKEELFSCGAFYASLTGTGSCVYGLFKEKPRLTDRLLSICSWQGNL